MCNFNFDGTPAKLSRPHRVRRARLGFRLAISPFGDTPAQTACDNTAVTAVEQEILVLTEAQRVDFSVVNAPPVLDNEGGVSIAVPEPGVMEKLHSETRLLGSLERLRRHRVVVVTNKITRLFRRAGARSSPEIHARTSQLRKSYTERRISYTHRHVMLDAIFRW